MSPAVFYISTHLINNNKDHTCIAATSSPFNMMMTYRSAEEETTPSGCSFLTFLRGDDEEAAVALGLRFLDVRILYTRSASSWGNTP
jgi:hypothetical protein